MVMNFMEWGSPMNQAFLMERMTYMANLIVSNEAEVLKKMEGSMIYGPAWVEAARSWIRQYDAFIASMHQAPKFPSCTVTCRLPDSYHIAVIQCDTPDDFRDALIRAITDYTQEDVLIDDRDYDYYVEKNWDSFCDDKTNVDFTAFVDGQPVRLTLLHAEVFTAQD